MLVDEKSVKEASIATFEKQFRKRNHQFDNMSEEWKLEYAPKDNIAPDIYIGIMEIPSAEEWHSALNSTTNKSAAGNSGIGYLMVKKASATTNDLLRRFTELCYKAQMVPLQ